MRREPAPAVAKRLAKLGLRTAQDLALHLPHRYEDETRLTPPEAAPAGTPVLVEGVEAQIHRVFRNLAAIAQAAGVGLDRAVRMTVYLTDLGHFARVNEIMAQYVGKPYPSRAAIGVASLPRGALVEIDCILYAG